MDIKEIFKNEVVFYNFLETSQVAMGLIDHFGNWLYMNNAHFKLLNYPSNEIIGKHFLKYSHPECQDHYENLIEEINSIENKSITVEKRFLPKEGVINWVKFTLTKLKFLYKNSPVYLCQSIEISEYKLIQEVSLLNTSNTADNNLNKYEKISSDFDRISKILDTLINADINTIIIAADIEENVILFNKGAEKKLGYKAEEVVGKVKPEIFHDREEVMNRMEELHTLHGKYFIGANMVIEYNKINKKGNNEWTYLKKDGTKLPVHLVITPVQNNSKEIIGHVGVITDLTESKKYQTELEEKNKELAFYNSFFVKMGTLTPSTVYVYDIKEGKNVYNNEAITPISGYTPSEIQEMGDQFIPNIMVSDSLEETQSRFQKLQNISDEEVVYHEYKIKHKNGNLVNIYSSEKAFSRDADGKVVEIIGVGTDITEIKKYQSELEEKNNELEQFAYIASHDLQEPLRTITSYTQLLLEQDKSKFTELELQYGNFIEQSVKRMKFQIEHLLNYSRLGTNILKEKVDLKILVQEILLDLGVLISEKAAEINYSHLPSIFVYKIEMRILLQNLIQNAIKFSYKNRTPVINIEAKDIDTHFLFSIIDNGIGIDTKYFDRIFHIFQQLDTEEVSNGYGIGLAYCKKIVNIHGGKIWVESKLNEGSTFYFTIIK